ncbi:hypothetical protein SK128_016405, partial [Halocaridina rubra]
MSCIVGVALSGQVVTQIVGVCGLAYGRGGSALQTVAQAAASQAIANLVKQLSEESHEQEKLLKPKNRSGKEGGSDTESENEEDSEYFIAPAYDELVPVMNVIADKLSEVNKPSDDKATDIPVLFLLECINTILTYLSRPGISLPSYTKTPIQSGSS